VNLPQGFGFTLFLVGLVSYLCYKCLEGGFAPNKGENAQTNITPKSILLAVASFGAGIFLLGPLGGIAIVLGIAIHEFGHVAAYHRRDQFLQPTPTLAIGRRPDRPLHHLRPVPTTQPGAYFNHERRSGALGALRPTTAYFHRFNSGLLRRTLDFE